MSVLPPFARKASLYRNKRPPQKTTTDHKTEIAKFGVSRSNTSVSYITPTPTV